MEIRTRRLWSLVLDALALAGLLAITYAATTATAATRVDTEESGRASIRLVSDESGLLALGIRIGEIDLLRR